MVRKLRRRSREGMTTRPSVTPIKLSLPCVSMKTKISLTAKRPTMATRKSTTSIRCRLPTVQRGMPVLFSGMLAAVPWSGCLRCLM